MALDFFWDTRFISLLWTGQKYRDESLSALLPGWFEGNKYSFYSTCFLSPYISLQLTIKEGVKNDHINMSSPNQKSYYQDGYDHLKKGYIGKTSPPNLEIYSVRGDPQINSSQERSLGDCLY